MVARFAVAQYVLTFFRRVWRPESLQFVYQEDLGFVFRRETEGREGPNVCVWERGYREMNVSRRRGGCPTAE